MPATLDPARRSRYCRPVVPASSSAGTAATPANATPSFRRSPSHAAEMLRRREWGKRWGAVGAAYKRARLQREA